MLGVAVFIFHFDWGGFYNIRSKSKGGAGGIQKLVKDSCKLFLFLGPISAVVYASSVEQPNATAKIGKWILKTKRKDNIAIHIVTSSGVSENHIVIIVFARCASSENYM